MAGHVQDRWWREKIDPETKQVVIGKNGKPEREKTDLYGVGLRYKVRYYDDSGKERSKSFPDKQLGKAQDFLTKMQHDVLAGEYMAPDAGKVTLKDFSEKYLKGRSQDPSSQETVQQIVGNYIYPFLGELPIGSITIDTMRDYLDWMTNEKGISVNFQSQIWDILSSILQAAKEERKIRTNPCRSRSLSRPRRIENKIVPWTETKLSKVELALPARWKIMVALGAGLGLRQGEVFAFTMDDVDREKMIYRCNRQIAIINNRLTFRLPKGHKTREIPLSEGVLERLDAYRENFPSVPITLPWSERDSKKSETVNLLIVNAHRVPNHRQTFNDEVWRRAVKRAQVERNPGGDGMHALRHLYASHLLAQGVSIRELADYLGHTSPAFTLRKYAHLMPSSHHRARLAVNSMIKPRKAAPATSGQTATGETVPDSRPEDV